MYFQGISSSLYNSGFFLNFPFVQLVNVVNSSPILNITVHDYLWGYYDEIITLAGTIVPGYVNFDKFGLVDRVSTTSIFIAIFLDNVA